MKVQSGFTLVEVIATSAISAILAGAIITALSMASKQSSEGIARERIIQIATAVSEQIQRSARGATTAAPFDPPRGVIFLGPGGVGDTLAGYKFDLQGYLDEWTPLKWIHLKVGPDQVWIALPVSSSNFNVLPAVPGGLPGVTFKLNYRRDNNGVATNFPSTQEQVLCRGNL